MSERNDSGSGNVSSGSWGRRIEKARGKGHIEAATGASMPGARPPSAKRGLPGSPS